ncbi:MAG TPA: hypothetical protein VLV78_13355 [Thermoanaerobaculia bacterium]|nr:hypothetical protein [Thermoanaerobaculia bacterium]
MTFDCSSCLTICVIIWYTSREVGGDAGGKQIVDQPADSAKDPFNGRIKAMLTTAVLLLLVSFADPSAASNDVAASHVSTKRFGPQWNALLGNWTGEGGGSPGVGSGTASFQFDLQEHAIIRRNVSDYPASEGRPAVHHEDLMVIYPGPSAAEASAFYLDNEVQTIAYSASWSADGKVLTFVSLPGGKGPQFRLSYTFTSPDAMTVTFEIAAPGSTVFKKFVGGVMKRSS